MFKDIEDIKKHLAGVQKNISPRTLLPYVDQAAAKYILPVIGGDFYGELQALALATDAPADGEDEQTDGEVATAVVLLQRALAYYTLLEALPFLLVNIGDLGVVESTTQNHNPVRQWNYHNLEAVTATNADVYLDQFLHHLEHNAEKFPTWEGSDEYTISRELLINSTTALNRLLPIGSSRRAFIALRPYLVRATDLHILPLVGEELMAKLLYPPADAPQYKTAAGHLAKALAQFAMLEALPELAIQFNGAGFKVLSENDGIRSRLNASDQDRAARFTKAHALASQYLAQAHQYLEAQVEALPEYKQAPGYEAGNPRAKAPAKLRNNDFKPSFRV